MPLTKAPKFNEADRVSLQINFSTTCLKSGCCLTTWRTLISIGKRRVSWKRWIYTAAVMAPKKLPIVEIIVDNNKVSGLKKTFFFRLEPMSHQVFECNPED